MNRGTTNFSDLRWGSLKERRPGSTTSLGSEFSLRTGTRLSDIPDILNATTHTLHRVPLYVFGEKAQIKVKIFSFNDDLSFCLLGFHLLCKASNLF